VNSSIIYLIHCKSSCKSHNVFPPSTTIKKKKRKEKRKHQGRDHRESDIVAQGRGVTPRGI
jgi:hypothetical protein